MITPKYRIIPQAHPYGGLAYAVQEKKWWGWKTVRSGLIESQAESVVEWLSDQVKYYDDNGNKIESC